MTPIDFLRFQYGVRQVDIDAALAQAIKERDQLWARCMMGSTELGEQHPIRVLAHTTTAQARAEERERCAATLEKINQLPPPFITEAQTTTYIREVFRVCIAAIRARGGQP